MPLLSKDPDLSYSEHETFLQTSGLPHSFLSLVLILSIPHYFVISNHIILLISKKNSKQILFNKKKFQINFKSETKYSPKLPRTPTRNPGNRFLFPRSPRNDKLPFPDSPNPRGMEIAGELASLVMTGKLVYRQIAQFVCYFFMGPLVECIG